MQKLTRTIRITLGGQPQQAAVNVGQVQYVSSKGAGSYICFNTISREHGVATPLGVDCAESFDEVVRRLNRPYWIDFSIRVGGLYLAALALILTLLFGPS